MIPPTTRLSEEMKNQKKMHFFFAIFELRFQPELSVSSFYHQYRNLVIASLKKKGDVLLWKNREECTQKIN